jgi:hypothetical protein
LNVEDNLPLPWLAQTSTVFSLTGLFGAYFGIAVTLGLPALLGLAVGTVSGLFVVQGWIDKTLGNNESGNEQQLFEVFLSKTVMGSPHSTAYPIVISLVQCFFAASELLILREVARVAFGIKSELATLLAIAVAIVGYFYLLLGGYRALFHTDRIQLVLVCGMALVLSLILVVYQSQVGWATPQLGPRPTFWEVPFRIPGRPFLYAYHFAIAAIMGAGCLLASPDTWKRVYQVRKDRIRKGRDTLLARALTFAGVGILPYLVLLPFAIADGVKFKSIANCHNAQVQVASSFTLPGALSNNWFFLIVSVGLIACFLSSFNGAFLASVHVALVWSRKALRDRQRLPEEARFYQIMMAVLIVISLAFFAGIYLLSTPARNDFNNPWLLGNLLMGGYAIIAGIQIGTFGQVSRLPNYVLVSILLVAPICWAIWFDRMGGFYKSPTVCSVNTVPAGVGLCLAIAIFCWFLRFFIWRSHRHD